MIFLDPDVIGPWVCERTGGAYLKGRYSAIGWVADQKLVAGALYENCNGANVFAHIAGDGNWLKRQFLWVIFDYPFNQLKVSRITAPVASTNKKCRRFIEHLGFTHEATLKDAEPDGDLLIYKMTRDECRWLRMKI